MVVPIDGKGKVLFYDDFEDYLPTPLATALTPGKWSWAFTGGAGAGGGCALSTRWARSKAHSVELTTRANAFSDIGLYRWFVRPYSRRIGLEFSFVVGPSVSSVRLEPLLYSPALYHADILIGVTTGRVSYRNSSNVLTPIATLGAITVGIEHTLKIVIDQKLNQYVRLFLDGTIIDMARIDYFTEVSPVTQLPGLLTIPHITPVDDANRIVWIDDFILTGDEP